MAGRVEKYPAPAGFRAVRETRAGRYPLSEVFPGLDETFAFRKYPGDDAEVRRIFEGTSAQILDEFGYMYVAAPKTPIEVRRAGYKMYESPDDVIVVARSHLTKSPTMYLYLDILHEFLHVLQRKNGRELWPGPKMPYVDRPTEVEAYAFSILEARRLGIPDAWLRKYLNIPWVGRKEFLRLLKNVGVSPPGRRR